jgi:hypothetical protein
MHSKTDGETGKWTIRYSACGQTVEQMHVLTDGLVGKWTVILTNRETVRQMNGWIDRQITQIYRQAIRMVMQTDGQMD